MGFSELIAHEAESLPADKQAEILDFIAFLKSRQGHSAVAEAPKTAMEVESFFRSFQVDVGEYRFSRDEANAR